MSEPPDNLAPAPPPPARWTPSVLTGLAGAVLLVSAIFHPETLPKVQACHFYAITGLPCPGCGLTRAFCAISHGQWGAAWGFNPFGFLFYLATLGVLILPWVWPRQPRLRAWVNERRWLVWSPLAVGLAMIAYNCYRWTQLWPGGLNHTP
jgi:hypothetical protein